MSTAVLCFLCTDPVSWFHRGVKDLEQDRQSTISGLPRKGDWIRVGVSLGALALAIRPAIVSDWVHLMGQVPPDKTYDPRFPFSEWKMYARPLHPSFRISLGLAISGIVLLTYSICISGRRPNLVESSKNQKEKPWSASQQSEAGSSNSQSRSSTKDTIKTATARKGWIPNRQPMSTGV